jgi:hypothetical protein
MRPPRYARRRDENEPEIVSALEAAGALVLRLNIDGAPDLLVGFRDRLYLLEIKHPARTKAHRAHQERQAAFRALWPACRRVETPGEALRAIGLPELSRMIP